MNSYQRVMAVLSREMPDRVPVLAWVRDSCMRFSGFGIVDTMENIEKNVFAQYEYTKHLGHDAVFGVQGDEIVSNAMGVELYYNDNTPPRIQKALVEDYEKDFKKIKMPDPSKDGRMPMNLEVLRRLKQLCGEKIPVIAWIQGPLRNAFSLRGYENGMRDLVKNQENFADLIKIAYESLEIYAAAVAKTGSDIMLISDPPSSGAMISVKHFERWSFPYLSRLVDNINQLGMKTILHVCGNVTDRLDRFAQLGVDALSIDETVDMKTAREIVGDGFPLMGNISPAEMLTLGTPEDVKSESRRCIENAGQNGALILGSGCLCPGEAKFENLKAMVETAIEYGTY